MLNHVYTETNRLEGMWANCTSALHIWLVPSRDCLLETEASCCQTGVEHEQALHFAYWKQIFKGTFLFIVVKHAKANFCKMERHGPSSSLIRWTAENREKWEQTVRRNFVFRWYMLGWPIFWVVLQIRSDPKFHYLWLVPWEETKLHANWLSCEGKIARVKQSKMATLEVKDDLAFNSATHEDASDFRCVFSFCLPLSSLPKKTCINLHTSLHTLLRTCAAAYVQQRDCCLSYLLHKRQFHFRLHAKLSWLGRVQTKGPRNL